MKIQDLRKGDKATIEVVRATGAVEIPATIVGSNDAGALLSPYTSNGNVIELNSKKLRNSVVSLYCVDEATGERQAWKGITVTTVHHNGLTLYAAVINSFSKYGVSSERRENRRMQVDKIATVANGITKQISSVTLHDISDNGISFVTTEDMRSAGGHMKVIFDDNVRDHYFRLELPCEYVRQQAVDGNILYGCRIVASDKRFLEYVNLKRMEMRRG